MKKFSWQELITANPLYKDDNYIITFKKCEWDRNAFWISLEIKLLGDADPVVQEYKFTRSQLCTPGYFKLENPSFFYYASVY